MVELQCYDSILNKYHSVFISKDFDAAIQALTLSGEWESISAKSDQWLFKTSLEGLPLSTNNLKQARSLFSLSHPSAHKLGFFLLLKWYLQHPSINNLRELLLCFVGLIPLLPIEDRLFCKEKFTYVLFREPKDYLKSLLLVLAKEIENLDNDSHAGLLAMATSLCRSTEWAACKLGMQLLLHWKPAIDRNSLVSPLLISSEHSLELFLEFYRVLPLLPGEKLSLLLIVLQGSHNAHKTPQLIQKVQYAFQEIAKTAPQNLSEDIFKEVFQIAETFDPRLKNSISCFFPETITQKYEKKSLGQNLSELKRKIQSSRDLTECKNELMQYLSGSKDPDRVIINKSTLIDVLLSLLSKYEELGEALRLNEALSLLTNPSVRRIMEANESFLLSLFNKFSTYIKSLPMDRKVQIFSILMELVHSLSDNHLTSATDISLYLYLFKEIDMSSLQKQKINKAALKGSLSKALVVIQASDDRKNLREILLHAEILNITLSFEQSFIAFVLEKIKADCKRLNQKAIESWEIIYKWMATTLEKHSSAYELVHVHETFRDMHINRANFPMALQWAKKIDQPDVSILRIAQHLHQKSLWGQLESLLQYNKGGLFHPKDLCAQWIEFAKKHSSFSNAANALIENSSLIQKHTEPEQLQLVIEEICKSGNKAKVENGALTLTLLVCFSIPLGSLWNDAIRRLPTNTNQEAIKKAWQYLEAQSVEEVGKDRHVLASTKLLLMIHSPNIEILNPELAESFQPKNGSWAEQ